ncbi:hypothetical protein MUK42_13516 [Musa troglodytarum]|uniref:Uncharacterized protein n=1 Tax=Musa troglodytarum TaxID=320322 RepID=A0A9E7EHJ7_9LILI|nr:hypothetical protein MUK42_13516 [Musa troglodytarum]
MSSSSNKTVTSPMGTSSSDDDLPLAFRRTSKRQREEKKSATSSQNVIDVSSSLGSQPFNAPSVSRDFVQMEEAHDCGSVVTSQQLEELRDRFQVSPKIILSIPKGEDRPFHQFCRGFCLSLEALEAGLRLPLPLVVVACLGYWRISPSEMVPNSWRFVRASSRPVMARG